MEEPPGISSILDLSILEDDSMPVQLYQKFSQQQLHPKCAFLASVGENDESAVKWMLKKYPIPQGENALEYFSIYPNGFTAKEYFTPMIIAWENNNKSLGDLLLPHAQVTHHVESPSSSKTIFDQIYNHFRSDNKQEGWKLLNTLSNAEGPLLITGYSAPFFLYQPNKHYPLFLAACSKKLDQHISEIKKLNIVFNNRDESDMRAIHLLLLTIIMNNDLQGLDIMTTHAFDNMKELLNQNLASTFYSVIGTGKNKSSFSSENEIRQLINYPILKDKKQMLLNLLIFFASGNNILDNEQIQKAKRILESEIVQ